MKRSEINQYIGEAIDFMEARGLALPPFAYWTPADWEKAGPEYQEIVDNMLGWDITDFGSGDFREIGLTIFTFRNGNSHKKDLYPKNYAEKLLLVGDGQVVPHHFHWSKMEDIINRGSNDLLVTLYNSDQDGQFSDEDVAVTIDGRQVVVKAGGQLTLGPGESITLKPGQYHLLQGIPGAGPVMMFEVSTTNDDNVDNRFHTAKFRLPEVVEDVEPTHLIFADYPKYVNLIK